MVRDYQNNDGELSFFLEVGYVLYVSLCIERFEGFFLGFREMARG